MNELSLLSAFALGLAAGVRGGCHNRSAAYDPDIKGEVDRFSVDETRGEVAKERELGTDPKSGKPVTVRMGRYGPFVQIGTKDDEEKPKFAGLRPGQKMNDVTLEDALELFKLPRKLGETPEGEPVSASIGRFGPYVRYGDKYVSIRGEDDPYTIELPRALELIEAHGLKPDEYERILEIIGREPTFTELGIFSSH